NTVKHEEQGDLIYYQVTEDVSLVHQVVNALYQLKLQSVLVEGGARLLQSFIDEGMWDEARVISSQNLVTGNGLKAPELKDAFVQWEQNFLSDTIKTYKH
ncbi:MAG: dihydrofolate reductase family protein, partial [Chitinophagaceae bacterium]|nr:dihydrofolate reductase family protein [Chitinophagaceae bacterium]